MKLTTNDGLLVGSRLVANDFVEDFDQSAKLKELFAHTNILSDSARLQAASPSRALVETCNSFVSYYLEIESENETCEGNFSDQRT